MNEVISAALAIAAASVVAFLAFRRNTLSASGAIAAAIVGALIVIGAGWWGGVILLTFFVTSSALSLMRARRRSTTLERHSRGHQRDAVQVLANGAIATLLAIAFGLGDEARAFAAFTGALAAANADTWATEIGGMSGQNPRLILSGKKVVPGVSGGVTVAGLFASLAGGVCIGLVAALGIALDFVDHSPSAMSVIVAATVGGLCGSIVDSVIGERFQAVYFCPACNLETEDHIHRCGVEAKRLRGVSVINNDAVNGLATLTGAIVAGLLTF
jgi:uncharacterized protein (TIGR00297 family)